MSSIQNQTEISPDCQATDPYAPYLFDVDAGVQFVAVSRSALSDIDRSYGTGDGAVQGCFNKTNFTVTERSAGDQTNFSVRDRSAGNESSYERAVGYFSFSRGCVDQVAKRFLDANRDRVWNKMSQADLLSLRDRFANPTSDRKLIVPLFGDIANEFEVIFWDFFSPRCLPPIPPRDSWQKYPGQDVFRVELDFADPTKRAQQNEALYNYVTYVNHWITQQSRKPGVDEPDYCPQTITPKLIADQLGSVDLMNLYYFAIGRLQEETRAFADSMEVKKVLAPEVESGISEIPGDWYEYYARGTNIPQFLSQGEYQSLLDFSGDNKITYDRLAELSEVDGHTMPWLEELVHSLDPQEKAELASSIQHFQNETWYADFTVDLGVEGKTPVSVFVDSKTGLCVIRFEHAGREITIESENDKHDAGRMPLLDCTDDIDKSDWALRTKAEWIFKLIALQFKTSEEIPTYCREIFEEQYDYDADMRRLVSRF